MKLFNSTTHTFLLILLAALLLFSCKEENFDDLTSDIIEESVIISRTDECSPAFNNNTETAAECSPGDYIVENGVLKFLSTEDFLETLNFLNCADGNAIYQWVR